MAERASEKRGAAAETLRIRLDDVGLSRPTLDEVFLSLTGRPPAATIADDDRVAA